MSCLIPIRRALLAAFLCGALHHGEIRVVRADDEKILTQMFNDLPHEEQELEEMLSDVPAYEVTPFEPKEVVEVDQKEEEDPEIEALENDVIDLLVKKERRKFPGWGPYIKKVKDICQGFEIDGRNLTLKKIVDPYLLRDENCPACYSLLKLISVSCQGKKEKKKAKVKEPAPTPTPSEPTPAEQTPVASPTPEPTPTPKFYLQREPTAVADMNLKLFLNQLLSDGRRLKEGRLAILKFVRAYDGAKDNLTPGERDYFSWMRDVLDEFLTLSEEADDSMDSFLAIGSKEEIHVSAGDEENVDELFADE